MSVLILHHTDADGRCSAAITIKYLNENGFSWINKECEYDQNIGEIPHYIRKVFVLDLSFSPTVFRNLCENYEVVWIDHHITAIEKLDDFKSVKGIRKIGVAACELTWRYLFPYQEAPEVVKLIGDRDVYNFKYGDRTRDFHEFYLLVDPSANSPAWDRWFNNLSDLDVEFGGILRKAKVRDVRDHIDKNAIIMGLFLNDNDGNSVSTLGMKVNISDRRLFSEAGDYILKEKGMDFAWLYFEGIMDGNRIRYNSLRSIGYDVGAFALAKGGGGHTRASGFIEKIIGASDS